MKDLWEAGCEIRALKTPTGGFSCMHVKSVIFDDKVALTGSVNLTHYGMGHNKEHIVRIVHPAAMAKPLKM